MEPRVSILASGSAGNATLLQADGYGLLIDAGLGPRQLAGCLAAVGASWNSVQAVLLTHTHRDHWNERTLAHLLKRRIALYCHEEHADVLDRWSAAFADLRQADLVRFYAAETAFRFPSELCCRPFSVCHDSGATFGFRFERSADLFGRFWSMAYASDLGCWDDALVPQFCDVELLALEFNHDVGMQRASRRSPQLIARVLGDEGHLSNRQAADLLAEVLRQSRPGRVRHVVQLHLSRECNTPELAFEAASAALSNSAADVRIHTASQTRPLVISETDAVLA